MNWSNYHYELVLTEDQSPTLRWLGSENQETMHHRGGAYSETQQIYGDPLRQSISAGHRSAISVGLGLGYNEILVACEAVLNFILPQDFSLLSYESEEILKTHFVEWLSSRQEDFVYDEIFTFFQTRNPALHKQAVKDWLLRSLEGQSWRLEGALTVDFLIAKKYEIIFYDAFSSKTSPHLWSEEFLNKFFCEACSPIAVVSTYACTGSLKRALRAQGFALLLPEGFHSKRNRTVGIRGLSFGI